LALDCGRFILQLQYWTDVKRNDFGYRFGYRHQFALIPANYAKLQMVRGLASPLNLGTNSGTLRILFIFNAAYTKFVSFRLDYGMRCGLLVRTQLSLHLMLKMHGT
jgi:hypothetical protein